MKNLLRMRFTIALICLGYSIFSCGKALSLWVMQEVRSAEMREIPERLNFGDDGTGVYFGDLLLTFLICAGCLGVFIWIVRVNRTLIFEIVAFVLLIIMEIRLFFFPVPGYLPGVSLRHAMYYIRIWASMDFIFVLVTLILVVLQMITIWKVYRNSVSQEPIEQN